jgi:predicted glycoside hydrolase/deacetylase ChbG (UPF0249 family)
VPDVEVSLLVPGPTDLEPVVRLFESRWRGQYEVIVSEKPQRGAALRDAFERSTGRVIMMLHPEQPCDPSFFVRAYDELRGGADLVRANRRHAESRFRIPVSVLPKVYARHRYGLAFNRLVRTLLPSIETRDTSAGNLVMSRRLARITFALQSAMGFLFDLELAIIATDRRFVQRDIPERLLLHREKTIARIGSELNTILLGLPNLWWRHMRGYYRERALPDAITADDWGMSPAVNRAIVELSRLGVVRRVSMLADAPYLRDSLEQLRNVETGLHFDMKIAPGRFLLRWLTSRMGDEVRAELRRQLDVLTAAGVTATYIDGHEHVHIVPGLIAAIAPVLEERGIKTVRLPYDRSLWLTRVAPVNLLSIFLRRVLDARELRYRRVIYPQPRHFRDAARLRRHITRWPDAEVIVHPATEREATDAYGGDRVREYEMLKTLSE